MLRRYLWQCMTDQCQGRGADFIKWNLRNLASFYGLAAAGHRTIYDRGWFRTMTVARPVISIGNLTVGGVGKTPLVETVSRYILSRNKRPAVLIRGYHAWGNRSGPASAGPASDEGLVLREALSNVPVGVGRDRVKNAEDILCRQDIDVFLMDDGFQYRRLKRDLDIVAIDATNAFGNGYLIPRGILREPLTALKRADMIVLTKSDVGVENVPSIEQVLKSNGISTPRFHAVHRPVSVRDFGDGLDRDRMDLDGERVCLLSAIGDPANFERMVHSFRADIRKHFIFPDHWWFGIQDIKKVLGFCGREKVKYLLTTAKDAVRLRPFADKIREVLPCWILLISAEITHDRENFFKRIDSLLQR